MQAIYSHLQQLSENRSDLNFFCNSIWEYQSFFYSLNNDWLQRIRWQKSLSSQQSHSIVLASDRSKSLSLSWKWQHKPRDSEHRKDWREFQTKLQLERKQYEKQKLQLEMQMKELEMQHELRERKRDL